MSFRRYDHLERFGHSEVEGIELGTVHVFPKLDGTNGVVYGRPWREGEIRTGPRAVSCGSRNRSLEEGDDNHGFRSWFKSDNMQAQQLFNLLTFWPTALAVYGEWMVPHTLKTYRLDAWRRFWIFDVFDLEANRYLAWQEYAPHLLARELDVVEPLCTFTNPSEDQLRAQLATNTYLIADGAGLGEGVVLKNYGWRNRHGRQTWAKIVRNEFKENNRRAFGVAEKGGEFQVELAIAEEFVTPALVGKTRAKVVADIANKHGIDLCKPNAQRLVEEGHRGKMIPALLGRVFHDLVVEETWTALKKHDMPTIDFKKLNRAVIAQVKTLAQDLFA